MSRTRRLSVALLATCLVAALAVAPTAGAAGHSGGKAKAAKSVKAKAAITKKRLNRNLNAVRRRTTRAEGRIRALTTSITTLQALANETKTKGDATAAGLAAAIPVVTDALTQLRDGSLALKTGLETLAAKTTEGFATVTAGFEEVKTAITEVATSQEYGVTKVCFGPGGAGGCAPLSMGSADIPDDGNTVLGGGTLPIAIGAPGNPTEGVALTLHSAIRSGESDGVAGGDPAGYVGGLLIMRCAGGPGAGGTCDTDPAGGHGDTPAALRPPGAIVCAVGPAPTQSIPIPGSANADLPLVTIPLAAERTDQLQPDSSLDSTTVNPLAGATAPSGPSNPLANDTEDGCNAGESGDAYTVEVQTSFVDIPTSEDPGATD